MYGKNVKKKKEKNGRSLRKEKNCWTWKPVKFVVQFIFQFPLLSLSLNKVLRNLTQNEERNEKRETEAGQKDTKRKE